MSVVTPCAGSDLRRTVLPNGLTVLSESMPGVRSVALGAWVRAASLHESAEKMGVSHMLEHMVFKGTPTRSAKELALALEVLGGSLDAYTSREHTSYQAKVLDEKRDLVLAAARKHGKVCAMLCSSYEQAQQWKNAGALLLAYSSDSEVLHSGYAQAMARIKG